MESELFLKKVRLGEMAYSVYGSGPKTMFIFHGYRDRFKWYDSFVEGFSELRLILIHLPYHGKTDWESGFIGKKDLVLLIKNIQDELGIESFSLLGYSMGGRVVSSIASSFTTELNHLFLIAPEGFGTGNLIDSGQMPLWGRRMIRNMVLARPKWTDRILKTLLNSGVLTKASAQFLKLNLVNKEERKRLMEVWLGLNEYTIPTFEGDILKKTIIVLGNQDRIIPKEKVEKWFRGRNVRIEKIDSDHKMITRKTAEVISNFLED